MPGRGRGGGFGGSGLPSATRMIPILEPPPTFPDTDFEKVSANLSEDDVSAVSSHYALLDEFGKYREFMTLASKEKLTGKDRKQLALWRHKLKLDSVTVPSELKWKKVETKKKEEVDIDEHVERVELGDEEEEKKSVDSDDSDEIVISPSKKSGRVTRKLDSDDEDEEEKEKPAASTDEEDEAGGNKDEVEQDDDYIQSYFDNGEDFLDEEDDNLDEGDLY